MHEPSLDYEYNVDETRKIIALILAGGRGTRLKELTEWRVKPAVPFGGKYRIIDFVLSNCVNSDVRKIGILTQYKSQSLIRHIMHGWQLFHTELGEFIECIPAQKKQGENWYSGTADAIYQNLDILHYHKPKYVLILAGDHIYKMDYRKLLAFHINNEADATIASTYIPIREASNYGVLTSNGNHQIKSFSEKPEHPSPCQDYSEHALVSMGVYLFNIDFLFDHLLSDATDNNSNHDFGHNIIPKMINEDKVYAFPFYDFDHHSTFYWKDVGSVDSYWEANMDLIGISPELNLYDYAWPIRTMANTLPPAKFVFNDEFRQGKALDSIVAEGCIVSGAHIEHSVLSQNVRVDEYSLVKDSIILPNVQIGSHCRIHKAIIDKECIIPEGTVIGDYPGTDRERFNVSTEGITLVEPEMLGQHIHRIE